jgi:hypothetical protein
MDHLLWVCNCPSQLLDPGHGQLPHYSIHNLCSNLLAALAVGGSPLDAIYRLVIFFSSFFFLFSGSHNCVKIKISRLMLY